MKSLTMSHIVRLLLLFTPGLAELSSTPRNFHHYDHTAVTFHHNEKSWLLATGKIISLFIFSGPRLTLNISISTTVDLAAINFSPFAVLETACQLIPRIDLYVCMAFCRLGSLCSIIVFFRESCRSPPFPSRLLWSKYLDNSLETGDGLSVCMCFRLCWLTKY